MHAQGATETYPDRHTKIQIVTHSYKKSGAIEEHHRIWTCKQMTTPNTLTPKNLLPAQTNNTTLP